MTVRTLPKFEHRNAMISTKIRAYSTNCVINICIFIYFTIAFWLTKCQKSAQYHIDRANSIVFTSKRLPLQPVSSERNHQVADKFRKMGCLNVYGWKCGLHSFHSLDCLLGVFFDDYMWKLFPIFYLANFVCFRPSKYKAFPPNINYNLFDSDCIYIYIYIYMCIYMCVCVCIYIYIYIR